MSKFWILLSYIFLSVQGAVIEGNSKSVTPELKFSYNGIDGPAAWTSIAPVCGGKLQSPINSKYHFSFFADDVFFSTANFQLNPIPRISK
jgi:carbonic anhydrase